MKSALEYILHHFLVDMMVCLQKPAQHDSSPQEQLLRAKQDLELDIAVLAWICGLWHLESG